MEIKESHHSMLTTTVSAIGSSLVEAASNCLEDQGLFFDGKQRFKIVAARRLSTSFIVLFEGHEGEAWEVWEFEVFGPMN